MKSLKEYKKLSICLLRHITVALTCSTVLLASFLPADAQTADELRSKINEASASKSEIEKEIERYQMQLKDIGQQANTLQNTIKTLDASSRKLSADIKLTEKEIELKRLEIKGIEIEIDKKVESIDLNSKAISNALRQINEFENVSLLETLLRSESISNFFSDVDDLSNFNKVVMDKIEENKIAKRTFESNKQVAERKQAELLKLKAELADRKAILDNNKKEQNRLLAETKNKESNYKQLLAQQEARKEALDRELAQYESELKFTLNKSALPKVGSGVLSWPLDSVFITQYFGMTDFAKSGAYNGKGHNGVDFRAAIGTRVKAALSGTVIGIGDTDIVCPGASWGKWVLIKHDNGLATIYGHLSLIKAVEGQQVTTGDVIGYSGKSGYSTGPHLHLTVYASQGVKVTTLKSSVCKGTYRIPIANPNAYLDPMLYL